MRVLIMNKRHWLAGLLSILVCLSSVALLFAKQNPSPVPDDTALENSKIRRVVLDAGHGGEDGGASSADGILEKELNLSVAFLLRDLLQANGIEVVMTRTSDTLLYDKNADYQGRKKALDFAERLRIANEVPDSVFVSIHMNTYPRADCNGLQVWYSQNHPSSKAIAHALQDSVRTHLQHSNHRDVKAAGSNIYLLKQLQSPAVLVECGFLSNEEEASRLCDTNYQRALAFSLFLALAQISTEG